MHMQESKWRHSPQRGATRWLENERQLAWKVFKLENLPRFSFGAAALCHPSTADFKFVVLLHWHLWRQTWVDRREICFETVFFLKVHCRHRTDALTTDFRQDTVNYWRILRSFVIVSCRPLLNFINFTYVVSMPLQPHKIFAFCTCCIILM